jgi:hypothetical protein
MHQSKVLDHSFDLKIPEGFVGLSFKAEPSSDAFVFYLAALTLSSKSTVDHMVDRLKLSTNVKAKLECLCDAEQSIASLDFIHFNDAVALSFFDQFDKKAKERDFFHKLNSFCGVYHTEKPTLQKKLLILCEINTRVGYLRHIPLPIDGNLLMSTFKIPAGVGVGKALTSLREAF